MIIEYERTIVEHYNETNPDYLRELIQNNKPDKLKQEVIRKTQAAREIKKGIEENMEL